MQERAQALNDEAVAAFGAGRYDLAAETLRRAISLDSLNAALLGNRSLALLHAHRYAEALEVATSCLAADPYYGPGYDRKGWALLRLARYSEAESVFSQGITLAPGMFSLVEGLRESRQAAATAAEFDGVLVGGGGPAVRRRGRGQMRSLLMARGDEDEEEGEGADEEEGQDGDDDDDEFARAERRGDDSCIFCCCWPADAAVIVCVCIALLAFMGLGMRTGLLTLPTYQDVARPLSMTRQQLRLARHFLTSNRPAEDMGFDLLDRDANNLVTVEDISQLAALSPDKPHGRERLTRWLAQGDRNGDGALDGVEYAAMVKELQRQKAVEDGVDSSASLYDKSLDTGLR